MSSTPRGKRAREPGPSGLSWARPLPTYPFVGKAYEIRISYDAKDEHRGQVILPTPVCFQVKLQYQERALNLDSVLEIEGDRQLNQSGSVSLQLRFKQLSVQHNRIPYIVECYLPNSDVPSLESGPISVVKYHLKFDNPLPERWFKDEGGRDNCMETVCILVDDTERPVTNRSVPLKFELAYDLQDLPRVDKADLLRVTADSHTALQSDGRAQLRCRINEVSKNHQNNSFIVVAEPDIDRDTSVGDVGAAFSTPVQVKSKRNKKSREREQQRRAQLLPVSNGLAGDARSGLAGISAAAAGFDPYPSGVAGPGGMMGSMAAPGSSGFPGGGFPVGDTSVIVGGGAGGGRSSESSSINSVVTWCNSILKFLQAIATQAVAYELGPNKQPDTGKPIRRCPACWRYSDNATIGRGNHASTCELQSLIGMYRDTTFPALNRLLEEIHGQDIHARATGQVQQQGDRHQAQRPQHKQQAPSQLHSQPRADASWAADSTQSNASNSGFTTPSARADDRMTPAAAAASMGPAYAITASPSLTAAGSALQNLSQPAFATQTAAASTTIGEQSVFGMRPLSATHQNPYIVNGQQSPTEGGVIHDLALGRTAAGNPGAPPLLLQQDSLGRNPSALMREFSAGSLSWLDENANTSAPTIDWPSDTLQFVSNNAIIVLGDNTIGDSSNAAHRHATTSTQYLAGYTQSKELLGVFRLNTGAQGTTFTWYNVHALPSAVKMPVSRRAVEFARAPDLLTPITDSLSGHPADDAMIQYRSRCEELQQTSV